MAESDPAVSTLELYKLGVEMADRVSARRGTANSFYVTLQSALIAMLGFLTSDQRHPDHWLLVAVCGAGVITAGTWFLVLRSYRDLNAAKFNVITRLEDQLPHRLFADEWATLKKDNLKWWRPRYAELGTVERVAPAVFFCLNLALGVYLAAS